MIKIKNNIFNENRIVQMSINEMNNLEIDTDNGFPIVIKNATFDDIQWEYDRFKVEADKDGVIFANRILEKKVKELQEKNKTFEDYNKDLNNQLDKLKKENERLELEKEKFKSWVNILNKDNHKFRDKIDYLEEKNKTLKELNVCVGCNNNPNYKSRIDKAIKYIESITDVKVKYFNYREFEKQGFHISNEELRKRVKEQKLEGLYIEIDREEILKILKGEE